MTISVRALQPEDTAALASFFSVVAADGPTLTLFHPHPFDAYTAERICNRRGIVSDEYFAAIDGGRIVGYGMLRGWDEGYDTPALGVCVHPARVGERLGSLLLDHAIHRARQRGARRLMLKVYPQNVPARRLYESRGFELTPGDDQQLVGHMTLL
jgi:ribosomal protein S18 acetylase RimI-like enzyme